MQNVEFYGAFIRHRRKELGMSQKDLGAAIGVSLRQICSIELGVNRTKIWRIPLLAKALKVDVAQICKLPPYIQIAEQTDITN